MFLHLASKNQPRRPLRKDRSAGQPLPLALCTVEKPRRPTIASTVLPETLELLPCFYYKSLLDRLEKKQPKRKVCVCSK